MTDNEIIKALECCSEDGVGCSNCPLDDIESVAECTLELAKHSLDLINRKQNMIKCLNAELESIKSGADLLKADNIRLERIRAELSKEIESLKIELQTMREAANSYKANLETAKSVAIREFVEIVKAEDFDRCIDIAYDGSGEVKRAEIRRVLFNKQIDNLVKEMVGDTE